MILGRLRGLKFSKHQKNIIRQIFLGKIYDISSYLKFYHLGTLVKFDKSFVNNSFRQDSIPKNYYCYNTVKRKASNILTEFEYINKLQKGELIPEKYTKSILKLSYNGGIKHEVWNGKEYTLNFYEGVYIANSFSDILEFLTIWQFLKSEMLILEVPQDFSSDILGMFYKKIASARNSSMTVEEQIQNIDYENFTYDDQYYLDSNYTLSFEHCLMCKEYLEKRIYPSTKLGLFIERGFKTYEEKTQNRALFVAWLAIFVSIILTFYPDLQKNDKAELDLVIQEIEEVKHSIDSVSLDDEVIQKLDTIIEKMDKLE